MHQILWLMICCQLQRCLELSQLARSGVIHQLPCVA